MDPIGLALESFDAVGMARTTENGLLIDTSGELDGTAYPDARGLGQALAQHPSLETCLWSQWVAGALGHSMPTDAPLLAQTLAPGAPVDTLLTRLAMSPAFRLGLAVETP
jgi:hypothetical protein